MEGWRDGGMVWYFHSVLSPQSSFAREDLMMQRFGRYALSLVFVAALWAMPSGAQDKFTLGMGGST